MEAQLLHYVSCSSFSANPTSSMLHIAILSELQTSLLVRSDGFSSISKNVVISPVGRRNIIVVSWSLTAYLRNGSPTIQSNCVPNSTPGDSGLKILNGGNMLTLPV